MTKFEEQEAVPTALRVGRGEFPLLIGALPYRRAVRIAMSTTQAPVSRRVNASADDVDFDDRPLVRRVLFHVSNEARLYGVPLADFADLLEQWAYRPALGLIEFEKLETHLRKPRSRPAGGQWPETLKRLIEVIPFDYLLLLLRRFDAAAAVELGAHIAIITPAPVEARASATEGAPCPWTPADLPLELGRDGSFFGLDSVHPEDLRNVLVLGETGSGKTVSAVIPYMNAALAYTLADGRVANVFVTDTKRELLPLTEATLRQAGATHRLLVLGENALPVRFFSLDCQLSMADRRQKIEALLPFENMASGSHAYWHENSMTKIYALLSLQAEVAARTPGVRLFNEWAQALGMPFCHSRSSWVVLKLILQRLCEGGTKGLKAGKCALHDTCHLFGITGPEKTVLDMYVGSEDSFMQFMYVVTCATPLLGLLTDGCLLKYVELDPVPDPEYDSIDLAALLEEGKVILMQPENWESARIAAKAVKGKVHEAVFKRRDRERPVFTVVDEFQRFVTNDPETGEQAYLDRCRGYRGMALYATQTLASLKHALGSDNAAQTAVDIMLANTPTKIIMRTTDSTTLDWLRTVLPGPPVQGPHVVDVHRPIELRCGQAYVIQANGHWALRHAAPPALQTQN